VRPDPSGARGGQQLAQGFELLVPPDHPALEPDEPRAEAGWARRPVTS
jgi:hypothetical protein